MAIDTLLQIVNASTALVVLLCSAAFVVLSVGQFVAYWRHRKTMNTTFNRMQLNLALLGLCIGIPLVLYSLCFAAWVYRNMCSACKDAELNSTEMSSKLQHSTIVLSGDRICQKFRLACQAFSLSQILCGTYLHTKTALFSSPLGFHFSAIPTLHFSITALQNRITPKYYTTGTLFGTRCQLAYHSISP